MRFRQIYKMAMDKMGLKEGNRRDEDIIKSAINTAYIEMYSIAGSPLTIEYDSIEDNEVYIPSNIIEVKSVFHSKLKKIPNYSYNVYNDKIRFSNHITIAKGENMLITLMEEPIALSADTDVPNIPVGLHMGLMYYALFVYNDNFQYLNRYNYYLDKAKPIDVPIDEETTEYIDWA